MSVGPEFRPDGSLVNSEVMVVAISSFAALTVAVAVIEVEPASN